MSLIESGSSLAVFRTCPKKYEFEYDMRLSTKSYPSAMGLGSFVHGLVEDYRKHNSSGFVNAIREFRTKFPAAEEQITADIQKAQSIFRAWMLYWESVDSESFGENNMAFSEVETEWAYELPNGKHVGKRDGYLQNTKTGKHYLYELKTSAASGEENYIHRLGLDHQISANITALQKEGKPVDGVLYDIIFKPMIRLKKGETAAEFSERFAATMLAEPEAYFKRVLVDRLPHALEQYNEETNQVFGLIEAGYRYRNTSACMKFNSLCPFFNACMDPGIPELLNDFNKREDKFPELREANVITNQEGIANEHPQAESVSVRPAGQREDPVPGFFGDGDPLADHVSRKRTPFSS